MLLQERHGALGHVAGGIKFFGHAGAPCLGRLVVVAGKLVRRPAQRVWVRMARPEPPFVVSHHLIRVLDAQLHVLETIVGKHRLELRVPRPGGRQLLVVTPADALPRLTEQLGRPDAPRIRLRHADHREIVLDALQVALADEGRVIPGRGHDVGERRRLEGERDAVVPDAVERRHPAGHQRGPVGHADGRGRVEPLEAGARRRQPVDVRRPHHRIAVATQMVRPVLVGDDEEEIGSVAHVHSVVFPEQGHR